MHIRNRSEADGIDINEYAIKFIAVIIQHSDSGMRNRIVCL